MANPEHLKILKRGWKVWNRWRLDVAGDVDVDLRGVSLKGIDLDDYYLRDVDFSGADLAGTSFNRGYLLRTDFYKANLIGAYFAFSNLTWASFSYANLRGAYLSHANLSYADLHSAKLTKATVGFTSFCSNDLSKVKGLNAVVHEAPSSLGMDTIYRSEGNIPEAFLRGVGISDTTITYIRSLINDPIQFYSCFISYSSKNQIFADRLYADLQYRGVRCWLASEDLKIGERIRIGIDESIRFHDKLLLVLSRQSVSSDWVEQEVETALERERKEKRTVLFPIRVDDSVMKVDTGWPALIKNTRHIGDFRKWRNPEAYQKAFDRLLRDLKAEEKKA